MDDLTRYATPESAVLKAIDGAGGAKSVGMTLRPEWEDAPDTASRWIHHCCGDGNRSKFGLRQLVWIFRTAARAGVHTGFRAYAESIGYRIEPLNQAAEIAALAHRAEKLAAQSQELSAEAMARMQAAHINVGALDS